MDPNAPRRMGAALEDAPPRSKVQQRSVRRGIASIFVALMIVIATAFFVLVIAYAIFSWMEWGVLRPG